MTITPALQKFVDQTTALFEKAEVEYGEPDGINFVRSVTFDTATSKPLFEILKIIEADERIESYKIAGKEKRLTLTVVPDVRADFNDAFPIEEVFAILNN